ncbi:hypothetical protein EDD86DRAFT_191991 [Gorgonomyces haynaldii]|nr:hypothetical protein EDD86DRAFT_191991 [Gorgonomyces haynaldii]
MDSAQFSQIWTSSIVDCLSQAHSQDFDIFALNEITNGRPLYFLTMHLLKRHGLLNAFELREQFLHNYLEKVESSYHKNPYHNSIHAADVLHTVSMLLLEPDISRSFSRLELFSVCIASAVHDLDHPGVGNPFLVAISHPMATIYNDIAVLESHHASRAFEIAKIPEMTIFQGLSTDQYKAAREMIISTVLATDMAQHFSFISKFKGKLSTESLNMQDDGDRQLVLKMAVKCGDLCNPTKKFNAAKRWTSLVMEEFFRQGEKELALGLPVSKFMDRHDTNVPKCQLGFIDVLVKPLFETWAQFQQNEFTGQCLSNMQANREVWAALQDKPFELDPVPDAFSPIQTIGLIESPFANLSFSTAQDRNRTRKEGSLRSYTLAPYPEDTTQLSGSAASVNVDEDNYDSIPVQ